MLPACALLYCKLGYYFSGHMGLCTVSPSQPVKIWECRSGRFPWEETVKASINIQLVRTRIVIQVDREHGTGTDHIAPAPTTYSVTRIGYNTVFCHI
jgi:hypothetical protein